MIKRILLIWMAVMVMPLVVLGVNITSNNEEDDDTLTKGNVVSMFTEFDHAISRDQQNEEQITFPYKENANAIASWLKDYRFIEVDTEIDRSWYERAAKFLEYMGECKGFLVRFVRKSEKDTSPEYQKVLANLKEAHKRFAELVKNPTPVEHNKLERLRAEKAKWEAQKGRK